MKLLQDMPLGMPSRSLAKLQLNMLLLLGLIALGWVLIALSVFDLLIRGVAGLAGPGMGVFSNISPAALSDSFGLPYKFSLCVTQTGAWEFADFGKSFLMWGAMILAMMLPTRLVQVQRKTEDWKFILGYLSAWAFGSFLAVILQWGLHRSGMLDVNMVLMPVHLGAVILIFIGVFQLSAFKEKRLTACQHSAHSGRELSIIRTPLHIQKLKPQVLQVQGENTHQKTLSPTTGWQAGINCILCCGPLMLLMFVFGLMNVVVMALMTALILFERHAAASRSVVKLTGVGLIVMGAATLMSIG